jgi:hypothetical protein
MVAKKIFDKWMDKFLWSMHKFDVNYNLFFDKNNPCIYGDNDSLIQNGTVTKDFYDYLPATLDSKHDKDNMHLDHAIGRVIPVELLEKAYLSLVVETKFFEPDVGFLSEKIFKPIAYLHPFILVGPVKSLNTLRNLGYKTFHPFINEEYDMIEDPYQRLDAIEKEIDRICSLSHEQMRELVQNCLPIALFNFAHRSRMIDESARDTQLYTQLSEWLYQ